MKTITNIINFILSLFAKKNNVETVTETPTVKPTEQPTAIPLATNINKYENICVMLDAGHCLSTPGKCSPDKRLKEYEYARKVVAGIKAKLDELKIPYYIVHPENDYIYTDKGEYKDLDSRDLAVRTFRINSKYSKLNAISKKCFLISVHVNAAGSNGEWTKANGYSVYVCKNASANSLKLAQLIYAEAEKNNLQGNRYVPACKYWEANYWILKKSACPAILTENMYQDNKEDVDYLLSETGYNTIVDIHVQAILKYIETL